MRACTHFLKVLLCSYYRNPLLHIEGCLCRCCVYFNPELLPGINWFLWFFLNILVTDQLYCFPQWMLSGERLLFSFKSYEVVIYTCFTSQEYCSMIMRNGFCVTETAAKCHLRWLKNQFFRPTVERTFSRDYQENNNNLKNQTYSSLEFLGIISTQDTPYNTSNLCFVVVTAFVEIISVLSPVDRQLRSCVRLGAEDELMARRT